MRIALTLLSCLALAACGRADARSAPPPPESPAQAADPRVTRADLSRISGNPAARVWILVVSDFQCPYCKEYHDQTASLVQKEFVETGKVRLAYINFPLRQHQNAVPAAEAAMCAGAQDRFWPFHDRLFATVDQWGTSSAPGPVFESIVTGLKLDLPLFRRCMSDHIMQPMIQADYQRGVQAGVNSTPTFLIGSQRLAGNAPIAQIRAAVNEQLRVAK